MANQDTPFGLRPVRHMSGAVYNGAVNPYWVENASDNALFIGDAVIATGTANTALVEVPGAGKFPPSTLPKILRATAGDTNRITGVVVSFSADPLALENVHRIDATERVAWVCDDPDVIFEIQGDSAQTIAATDVGNNADLIFTHAGSATSALSGMELDGSTITADASNQLIIMRGVNREDNDLDLTHAKWEVMISNHTLRGGGAASNEGVLGV
jgi:hypothetical protein